MRLIRKKDCQISYDVQKIDKYVHSRKYMNIIESSSNFLSYLEKFLINILSYTLWPLHINLVLSPHFHEFGSKKYLTYPIVCKPETYARVNCCLLPCNSEVSA